MYSGNNTGNQSDRRNYNGHSTVGSSDPITTVSDLELSILKVVRDRPDSEGDFGYEGTYSIVNPSSTAVELIQAQMYVLNSSGLVAATATDEIEDMITRGEKYESSISTWGANLRDFNGQPSIVKTMMQIKVSYCTYLDLGSIEVPFNSQLLTYTPLCKIDNITPQSITVGVESSEHGESNVRITAMIKNPTQVQIARLMFDTRLVGQNGRELDSTSCQIEMPAMSSILLEDSLWGIKNNRLQGSRLQFSLKAYVVMCTKQTSVNNASESNFT
jgi:hypothetical protein